MDRNPNLKAMPDVPILGQSKVLSDEQLQQLGDCIGNVLMHLTATDAANAYVNCSTSVQPRPLTLKVMAALNVLETLGLKVSVSQPDVSVKNDAAPSQQQPE